MKRGFTLIELIVVVIVIGILATLAAPQYLKAVERTKWSKAKNALGLIASGEKMYRAENDTYIVVGVNACEAVLGNYVELSAVDTDLDWNYDVTAADASTFTAQATRERGPNVGAVMTLTESGVWVGDAVP